MDQQLAALNELFHHYSPLADRPPPIKRPDPRDSLKELRRIQALISDHPYSIASRIGLASAYQSLGYPDLAAGESYKALLLTDELADQGEYYDETLQAAQADVASMSVADRARVVERRSQIPEMRRSDPAEITLTEGCPTQDDEVLLGANTCWSETA